MNCMVTTTQETAKCRGGNRFEIKSSSPMAPWAPTVYLEQTKLHLSQVESQVDERTTSGQIWMRVGLINQDPSFNSWRMKNSNNPSLVFTTLSKYSWGIYWYHMKIMVADLARQPGIKSIPLYHWAIGAQCKPWGLLHIRGSTDWKKIIKATFKWWYLI